ncbi:hypothetical protein Desaci_2178 [Desulfosporosinus acidiphilus SJ4]|uniref:DUF2178 domain-containing protein n=1 Tax=Desulfosporosinus acidiphilus (strain DSM 22704 / JCM 16185 / SJ4) TaxID=646529 RepID=I4D5R6_DESAJ|nr:hypothetical protein [Desulfosporosinus acidiphilus]AFM41140.1 hypothetical protein Desaci_2178 [Desulfosporosinus acidiphilus SJ4]
MKRNKLWLYILLTIAGAVLFYLGGFVLVSRDVKQISGLGIGLGAALFCLGIGKFFDVLLVSHTESEKMKRRIAIELNDERNIRLKEKVGAKINQILIYLLSLLVMTMSFMGAKSVFILMVAAIMFIQLGLSIILFNYYGKRM